MEEGFTAFEIALEFIPIVGGILSEVSAPIFDAVAPEVTNILNAATGAGDDQVRYTTIFLSPKQMVLMAARVGNSWERNIGYKIATPLLSGDGGSYKVYFGVVPA